MYCGFHRKIYLCRPFIAHVAKLADAPDLGSGAARHGGSSPSMGTNKNRNHLKCR